jgi:hypothetical protein
VTASAWPEIGVMSLLLDDRQAPAAGQPSIHWPPSTLMVWPVM